jgi:hypothetical protein
MGGISDAIFFMATNGEVAGRGGTLSICAAFRLLLLFRLGGECRYDYGLRKLCGHVIWDFGYVYFQRDGLCIDGRHYTYGAGYFYGRRNDLGVGEPYRYVACS